MPQATAVDGRAADGRVPGGCRIVIMAKAPEPGRVKTRLIPALGAEGAARLARRMLAETVDQAFRAGVGPVEVCAAPDAGHPLFAMLRDAPAAGDPAAARPARIARTANGARLAWSSQGDGDLGERMDRASRRALARDPRVLVIGTDAPRLDAVRLQEAAEALARHDVVVIPALDGGYVLIGLSRPLPELFEAMPWSTPAVMEETRRRMRQHALRWWEGAALPDVDEPDDLRQVPPDWLL
jgi:hypothetical protein